MPNEETPSDKGQEGDAAKGIDPQELAKMVNAAVSSQLKRSLSGLPKLIKEALAEAMPSKTTEADADGGDVDADPKAGAKTKTPGGEAPPPKVDNDQAQAMAAMQKRLDKVDSDLKDARKAAAQANRRAAEEKGYAAVRNALAAKGIAEGPGLSAALDLLRSRGQIVIDDEGNAKLKLRAEFERGLGEEERELSLGEALPHYLKTPDAALFLPAPTRGSQRQAGHVPPQRAGTAQPSGNPLQDKLAAEAERLGGGKPLNDSLLT